MTRYNYLNSCMYGHVAVRLCLQIGSSELGLITQHALAGPSHTAWQLTFLMHELPVQPWKNA